MSSAWATLTLLGLCCVAWSVLDHLLQHEGLMELADPRRSDVKSVQDVGRSAESSTDLNLQPDLDFVCAQAMASVDQQTVATATGNGDVRRVSELLEGSELAGIWRAHLALCRRDPPELAALYRGLKLQTQRLPPRWQGTQLYQEAEIGLAVATSTANPAASYRGLDAVRRLRLASPVQGWPLDRLEQQLRLTLVAFEPVGIAENRTSVARPVVPDRLSP